jgi:hypothetical protein
MGSHRKRPIPTNRLSQLKALQEYLVLLEAGRKGDLYLIAFDADGAAGHGEVWIALPLACADVEFPPVPRACHDLAGQMAFADRSSCVRTGIVDREKRTGNVEQRDPHSIHLDGLSGSRWNVFYRGDGYEFRHTASCMWCGRR